MVQREKRKQKTGKRKGENKKSTMSVKKRLSNNSSETVNNERNQFTVVILLADRWCKATLFLSSQPSLGFFSQREKIKNKNRKTRKRKQKDINDN